MQKTKQPPAFSRWLFSLDNATLHGPAMKASVREWLAEIADIYAWPDLKDVNLAFLHTPAYSPAFNPAEWKCWP
ncbi:MAG: hypothetical protein PHE55_21440 [Methylococcaceae bacterium]|nr:hypothetical protein [Methylococcaceae bacterium]